MDLETDDDFEIEAIVAGLDPTDESDAIAVLATWRQRKTAMTRGKLTRGWRQAGVVKPGCTAGSYNNASRLDLARLDALRELSGSRTCQRKLSEEATANTDVTVEWKCQRSSGHQHQRGTHLWCQDCVRTKRAHDGQ